MADGIPADLEHIKRLLDGEAEQPQAQQAYKRRRHRPQQAGLEEARVVDPAAEAIVNRAKQPSDKSTTEFWHCELCNVRVGRPANSTASAAAAPDWIRHVGGKLHRRNQASVHLHGEAGHSVTSVFEQQHPSERCDCALKFSMAGLSQC